MEKKLEVKNLQVSFRTQGGNVKAVRDISFDLYKGETLAIVGESGSGKSVTSKAIIGILAGNSIVEGGEILYNGQDLLKISEEDFHKIRGDKIAMIFQDPMSSLNPIMRVGHQLTEAMILKSKSSQKNAKEEFNQKLKLLNEAINKVTGVENAESVAINIEKCTTFDNFCILSNTLENDYNEAYAQAIGVQVDIDNLLFLLEKNQKVDINKEIKKIKKEIELSVHPYIIKPEEANPYITTLSTMLNGGLKELVKEKLKQLRRKEVTVNQELLNSFVKVLSEINALYSEAINRQKPNFFTLGYYKMKYPEDDIYKYSIDELDKKTREVLDDEFMLEFIKLGQVGVQYSHDQSIKCKKEALAKLDQLIEFIQSENLVKKETFERINEVNKIVKDAIDRLTVNKNSIEYTFSSAVLSEAHRYFNGIKDNPVNQEKYDKDLVKFNKLIEAGKRPTWQPIPPRLVDLELTKQNIVKIIENLKKSYENDIEKDSMFDSYASMIALVDYFKQLASLAVYKVTHQMAKAKAIKLLEEVGIPDPEIRYRQYPFEFSGGMRQRIVIAIALSANPDILICDEPTTALDVTIQSQILELINKIKVERNLSVIFITHDLGVVANMADRIAVMYAGKIVEYGTSEDIFYDPRHPYTWALLSSMPDLDTKEKLEAIPGTPPNMIYPPKGDAFAERNKYALEIDFELQPPLFEVSETHFAATWLLHPNAPKVDPPKIIAERIQRMKAAASNEGGKDNE